jgi:hypothetical protein
MTVGFFVIIAIQFGSLVWAVPKEGQSVLFFLPI